MAAQALLRILQGQKSSDPEFMSENLTGYYKERYRLVTKVVTRAISNHAAEAQEHGADVLIVEQPKSYCDIYFAPSVPAMEVVRVVRVNEQRRLAQSLEGTGHDAPKTEFWWELSEPGRVPGSKCWFWLPRERIMRCGTPGSYNHRPSLLTLREVRECVKIGLGQPGSAQSV